MAELLVKDLWEQMANIATEARSKLNEMTAETPEERAAEIEREFDAIMSDHDKLQARIQREERAAKALAAIEEPVTAKVPVQEGRRPPAVDNRLQMDYRHAFAKMVATGGDAYVDQEVRNVLKEYRVQVGGTNTSGGFTVPTTLANFIVESIKAHGPIYSSDLFNVINDTSGNTFNIPTVDDTAVTV